MLGLLVLVAASVRLWRLDFDLPDVVYVDGYKFVGEATRMVETGNFEPAVVEYPGLYTYLLVALYRVLDVESVYGRYLAASCVSAVAGTLVVPATAFLARAVTGTPGTLLAAAFAALSPALVTQSRTPAPDALSVLFATVALGIAARRPTSLRRWAAAGLATGLATGSKWTGAFVAPAVAAAAAAASWRSRRLGLLPAALLVSATCAFLALWAATPFIVGRFDSYARSAAGVLAIQRAGQIGRVQLGPLDYLFSRTPTWEAPWLGTSLMAEMGLPALSLAAGGLALAAGGRLGFAGALYGATTLVYLASISGTGWLKALRFLLPSLPLVWVLAGACGERLLPRTRVLRLVVGFGLALAALLIPIRSLATYLRALGAPSTNAGARDWLRAHVPAESVVFVGPFYTNDLGPLPFRFDQTGLGRLGSRLYNLPPELGMSPERELIYSPELVGQLQSRGVQWVVLNSYFDDAFSPVPENLRFFPRAVRGYEDFVESLRQNAELVHVEMGWTEHRLGPDIRVWRLRSKSQ